MKSTAFLLLSAFSVGLLSAQDRIVSGSVSSSEDGSSLPGVSVLLKGTTSGTVTDVSGNYRLSVTSDSDTLEFSFVGMKTVRELVGQRAVIDVRMAADISQLAEVVVVAYGEETKKSLMGSVASIGASEIQSQQIASVTRSLSGAVPGVSVISDTGQPGVAPTIRIRGIASIDSGNDPLIVLDGSAYNGNINTIPSSDIASISVLKDASAAALYGSRAANGVVVITTKKVGLGSGKSGKLGKPNIDFRMTSGVSYRARRDYRYLNAAQAMRMEWEVLRNDFVDGGKSDNPGQEAADGLLKRVGYNPFGGKNNPIDADGNFTSDAQKLLWDTDWEKAMYTEVPLRNEYSIGFSDGGRRIGYFLGGSILDQSGQVKASDFKRYTMRANLNAKLTEWLFAELRQSISSSEQGFPYQDGTSYSNAVQWIRTVSNIYPIYKRDEEGKLVMENDEPIYDTGDDHAAALNGSRPPLSPGNTVGLLHLNKYHHRRFSSVTNFVLTAHFLKDFTLKTSYQMNKYTYERSEYSNPLLGSARSVKGRSRRDRDVTTEWTWTNSLSWHKRYGAHTIDVLLLQELYDYQIDKVIAQGTGFPFAGLDQLSSAATPESVLGSFDQERISSFMGRFKYNFGGKYFFEGSYRRDASSRFSPETRDGDFFAFAGSWVLTEEPFWSLSALNFAKIRISYGELGNNNILDDDGDPLYFPYLPVYETGYGQPGVSGVYPAEGLANRLLTWEAVATLNVGVDFGLFEDRLTGTVDLYSAVTRGLVTSLKTIPSRGVRENSTIRNIGDVTNSGIEVALSGDVIKRPDFTWRLSGNIAFERNRITDFPEGERIVGSKKLVPGGSIYDFWIQDYAGVDPENGKPMWWKDSLDSEGNVVAEHFATTEEYDEAGRYFVGTALPWARGGFSSRIDFKGFDFSFLINFALGGKIYDYDYAGLMHGGRRAGQQYSVDILNRWQQSGDKTNVPRLSTSGTGNSRSTRFLFDATYARLRNITLGYSLPPSLLDKMGGFVKSFRIFFSGENLITLFGRQGLDPEQNVAGTTDDRSALMNSYSGGLELKF